MEKPSHMLSHDSPLHPQRTYLNLHPAYPEPASYHGYRGHFSCMPHPGPLGLCEFPFEPAFIRKRNERERQRVRCVNEGYARLRDHLPPEFEERRMSKVETLRAAIDYIRHLQGLLEHQEG